MRIFEPNTSLWDDLPYTVLDLSYTIMSITICVLRALNQTNPHYNANNIWTHGSIHQLVNLGSDPQTHELI